MRTRIQKWGNSLALRIPKSFAVEVNLEQGSEVEVSSCEGLLTRITEQNRHREVDTGRH